MADVRTQYTSRERKERRKDKMLGTAVGGSAVGLAAAEANTRPGSLAAMKSGMRSARLTMGGRSYPRTAKTLALLRSAKGPGWKGAASATLLGLTAAGGRYALREPEPKQFVAKSDTWKELKSQTVYGMPSHQTKRLGARGRAEAMARSIPDPALPFVAPKGERSKAANAQTKATLSGAALGTAAGAAAGALVGGPKAWRASARGAKASLKQLKNMRSAARQPTLPGMKPSAKDYAQMARKKAAARFTPQRRADLARGSVGGAVTGAAVNINSANAAKETVASNPQAWERNDRKIQGFVNKGVAMPSLAEIAKATVRHGDEVRVGPGGRYTSRIRDKSGDKKSIYGRYAPDGTLITDARQPLWSRSSSAVPTRSGDRSWVAGTSASSTIGDNLRKPGHYNSKKAQRLKIRERSQSEQRNERVGRAAAGGAFGAGVGGVGAYGVLGHMRSGSATGRGWRAYSRMGRGGRGAAVAGGALLGAGALGATFGGPRSDTHALYYKDKKVKKDIAKRDYAESESARKKYGAGAIAGIFGGAGAIDYGVNARRASKTNRESSRWNARNRRAHMDSARRSVASAERAARHGRFQFGTGAFTPEKARGMRGIKRITDSHLADAEQAHARGRRSGKLAARQRGLSMRQAKRGKWALAGGGAAIAGGTGLALYGSRKKKVRKDIEPDVDPSGFLEQVKRQNEALRDSGGRFAGKVVDDVGPAVIAAPYAESEEA